MKGDAGEIRTIISTNADVSLLDAWAEIHKGYITLECLAKDGTGRPAGKSVVRAGNRSRPLKA